MESSPCFIIHTTSVRCSAWADWLINMNESSKTRKIWGELENSIISGNGIDIGCGPDPVTTDVRKFDIEDGDASNITEHVHEQFDFVYSSHCLEHMDDPVTIPYLGPLTFRGSGF